MLKSLFKPLLLLATLLVTSHLSYGQTAIFEYYLDYSDKHYEKALPVYINGELKGLTNQQIELENGEYYVVVQNGKDFYGGNFNKNTENWKSENLAYTKQFGQYVHQTVNRPSVPSTQTKPSKTKINNNNDNNIKYNYKSDLIVYSKNGKYGYKDKDGKIVIKAKYNDAQPFIDELNCAIVKKGEKYGIINEANDYLIKPQYDHIEYIHKDHFLIKQVKKPNSFGYYGTDGIVNQFNDIIIDPSNLEIKIHSNYYVCRSLYNERYYYNGSDIKYYWHIHDQNGKRIKTYVGCCDIKDDIVVIRNGSCWFDNISSNKNNDQHIKYRDVEELANNTYLTSMIYTFSNGESKDEYKRYGFVDANGKQIVAPVFSYVDTKKWERGEWQYTKLEHNDLSGYWHNDIFLIRYDNEINEAEILSFDQFWDKYGNAFTAPYTSQHSLNFSPLYSPSGLFRTDEGTTFEESCGEDSYLHNVYWHRDLGDLSFKVLDHITQKQRYLYITQKNNICKKLAFRTIKAFANLSDSDIQINGISTLSNGDYLLEVNANIVTGSDTYMRDPVYVNVQGQLMVVDKGGAYSVNHRDNFTVIFILDGKTYNLKYSRIMPHGYDNIFISRNNGFFAYRLKQDHYYNSKPYIYITTESPLLKFTNSCRDDWSFVPNEGEGINCLCENDEYIYLGGYTKNTGYIGHKNPYICKLDLKSGNIVKSRSYKILNREINSLKNGVAVMSDQSISILDNFEDGNIKLVDITHSNLTFTGLVYNDKYWLIPPVLPGQDKTTYAEWTIFPPEITYDKKSKKIIQSHSKTTKNENPVNVDLEINTDTK